MITPTTAPNILLPNGFLFKVLEALGITLDFTVDSPISMFLYGLGFTAALIFIVCFIVVLFRCLSSLFRGARL